MSKPILAIITHSIRMDNHLPLKYFKEFEVKHFYFDAPYGDLNTNELTNVVQWHNFKDLEKQLIDLNPDLIQGSEPYASKMALRICLTTMKVAKKLKKPYFFPMFENRPVKNRFNLIVAVIVKAILKKYATGAKIVFYANKGAKRNLLDVGINEKKLIRSVYGIYGIDTYLFKPTVTSPIKSKSYILYVGRLIEDKGIHYLLAAWNSIKEKFPNINLVFIGSGKMESDIKGSQIVKLGQMKNADLPPYFSNALFTVYPSITMPRWEEQVGTVNLQSLACGTPVLTTSSGAIPEYVTDEVGVVIAERDANALVQAMEKLIKNNEFREKLAKNARPYIIDNYDAQKNVGKIEKILLNLL